MSCSIICIYSISYDSWSAFLVPLTRDCDVSTSCHQPPAGTLPLMPLLRYPTLLLWQLARISRFCQTRRIHTLNPAKPSSSDFLDLSGCLAARVPVSIDQKTRSVALGFKNEKGAFVSFPSSTQRFLYYRSGPSYAPVAGELRFCVTSDVNPASFDHGHDLEDSVTALPWNYSLAALVVGPSYARLISLLLIEGDSDLSTAIAALQEAPIRYNGHTSIIHSSEQLILLNLAQTHMKFHIAHGNTITQAELHPLRDRRLGRTTPPYKGTEIFLFLTHRFCSFLILTPGSLLGKIERVVDHPSNNLVVLRVVKILDPPTPVDTNYDGYIPIPRVGEFL
jgi:hypothetical protein